MGGRPSIDPVVVFKLRLLLFFAGLRSERKLMATVALNRAQRWYLGYALDESLPDHSRLTRSRNRLGLAVFQRFFEHVVELCQAAGLVWGRERFFDGTKVRANADVDSLVPRWYQRAKTHLDDRFTDDATASPDPEDPAACEDMVAIPDRPCISIAADAARLAESTRARWTPRDRGAAATSARATYA